MFKPALIKVEQDGITYFTDPNLKTYGSKLFFTTRLGGFSLPPYAQLNLAFHVGDRAETVAKNWQTLAAKLNFNLKKTFLCEQVHGDKIKVVASKTKSWPNRAATADGLVTGEPGFTLAILTADCVPIVFIDSQLKRVAAVHAGWRGTYQEIATKCLQKLVELGSKKENIIAYLGPAIGGCCYQVPEERLLLFRKKFNLTKENGLNLAKVNYKLLTDFGLKADQICLTELCTACHREMFYSYRQQKTTGRQAAIVGLL